MEVRKRLFENIKGGGQDTKLTPINWFVAGKDANKYTIQRLQPNQLIGVEHALNILFVKSYEIDSIINKLLEANALYEDASVLHCKKCKKYLMPKIDGGCFRCKETSDIEKIQTYALPSLGFRYWAFNNGKFLEGMTYVELLGKENYTPYLSFNNVSGKSHTLFRGFPLGVG